MKKIVNNAVIECCDFCTFKIDLLPEKGLGHLGIKCSKLLIKVNPNQIHPDCPLPDVEVYSPESKDLYEIINDISCLKHRCQNIEKIIIVRKAKGE